MKKFLKKKAPIFFGLFLFLASASAASASGITLLAVGDILPQASWQRSCIPVGRLLRGARGTLSGADVAIGNLETPLTDNAEVTPNKDPRAVENGKDFVFKCAGAQAARGLKKAGFSVLTLANNHIMDYNGAGLSDTLGRLKKAGILTAGAGNNIYEAERPCAVNAGGMKFIVFSASDIIPRDYDAAPERAGVASIKDEDDLLANIVLAREDNPEAVIVLCLHWGVEATYAPTKRQQTLAHEFIEAGADLILGSHPHRVQGVELYMGRPIFYSLGNFQFDCKGPGNETFMARVVYRGGDRVPAEVGILPVLIRKGGYPKVLGEREREYSAIVKRYNEIAKPLNTAVKCGKVVPLKPDEGDAVPDDFQAE